ncbi:hypothetical protein CK5_07190 [Blautia obeum A2-162]|uniref:Uncharacterized protein n=1 Tax=Blautia obeum A2-162 TaxID=657314 RepID=D4LXB2_9FIRM|nr:hypothetical protein CK5_07190 [Blautia obeum A2-162]
MNMAKSRDNDSIRSGGLYAE